MQDIVFDDEFEDESDICSICGADTSITGWNEALELTRFECADCGAVLVYDNEFNETLLKGEKRNWLKFLSENLRFPFTAVVTEFQDDNIFAKQRGPIKQDDKVVVHKLLNDDDLFGIIVELSIGKKRYHFPLSDLAVIDELNPICRIVLNYCVWFANCRG